MSALIIPGVPAWVVPAVLVHLSLVLVLILPVWRAFAQGGLPGVLSLVLLLPGVGLLAVAVLLAIRPLRVAGWSLAWAFLALVPVVNIVFLWVFAFAEWSEREKRRRRREARIQEEMPRLVAVPEDDMLPAGELPSDAAATGAPEELPAESPDPGPDPAPHPAPHPASEPPRDETLAPGRAAAPVAAEGPEGHFAEPAPEPAPAVPPRTPTAEAPAETPVEVPAGAGDPETLMARGPAPSAPGRARVLRIAGANARAATLGLVIDEEELGRTEAGMMVGRSTRADFVITDESVSRNHARFVLSGGSACVEDLDSMNGTWVDGAKLEPNRPVAIGPGSAIEFGKVRLTVSEG